MYAIIESGNKQYKVKKGDVIDVELLGLKPEDAVKFEKVLLVSSDDKIEVGTPYVAGAKVMGKLMSQFKDKKVTIFKYKNKINYHRKIGHRQLLDRVAIEEVSF
jgi:large subunit ribosomal protein L21